MQILCIKYKLIQNKLVIVIKLQNKIDSEKHNNEILKYMCCIVIIVQRMPNRISRERNK